MFEWLAVVALTWAAVLWTFQAVALVRSFSFRVFKEPAGDDNSSQRKAPCLGVSIIKPLLGVNPTILQNLRSFMEQDYPKVLLEYQCLC